MTFLEYAQHRLRAFLEEAGHLKEIEFPYPHSKALLTQLDQLFQRKLSRLEGFDVLSDPAIVKNKCGLTLRALFNYVPLLGFALRSTNVRNAFEVFGPLLRLARDVLEPGVPKGERKTLLVLSSEWDYSPFTYPDLPDLPDFVMIGLPAPESSNPLLVPLAGHELGHSVWAKSDLEMKLLPRVKQEVLRVIEKDWRMYENVFPYIKVKPTELTTDLFAIESWGQAVPWALCQAEESFCDFVGVRLFGLSFLNAFAYLLSPKVGPRSVSYPNMRMRAQNLESAAKNYGVDVPTGYADMFEDDKATNLTRSDEFRVSVADQTLSGLVSELIAEAELATKDIGKPSKEEIDRIYARLQRVVPAEHCKNIADILNAAWLGFGDSLLWADIPQVRQKKDKGS